MEEYEINKPYYSLTKGKWKFIVLDSIQCKNSIPGYFAQLDEEQMNWLKDELSNTPQDNFICIISHVPILAICTMFDSLFTKKRHRRVSSSILHADAGELTSMFYQFPNVKSCLSGHIHMIDHVNYLGVDYYCNGAVSGSWWKGNHHQFPPSFSIMNFFDDGKVVKPEPVRMLAFKSGTENVHGVNRIKRGDRYAIAIWFTKDKDKIEQYARHE
jgi:3',5'-cyclic AMP phosphodiesterase CpdA